MNAFVTVRRIYFIDHIKVMRHFVLLSINLFIKWRDLNICWRQKIAIISLSRFVLLITGSLQIQLRVFVVFYDIKTTHTMHSSFALNPNVRQFSKIADISTLLIQRNENVKNHLRRTIIVVWWFVTYKYEPKQPFL